METRRWLAIVALSACGLAGFAAASRVRAADPKEEAVEAEMLKDLDLLRETNMAQQAEFLRRMTVLERLRLLESLGFLEGSASPEPQMREEK